MGLISKQENIIKDHSKKFKKKIDNLKMKLLKFEQKLSDKSVKVVHEAKKTDNRQSSEWRNKDDILGDKASTPEVDKTKVVDDFNQTKPQETIYVNQ